MDGKMVKLMERHSVELMVALRAARKAGWTVE